MRATLSICPTIPLNADLTPDSRFIVLRQFAVIVPTYGNDYLIFGQPQVPPPANAVLVLHDGLTDWHWGDLVASHPALQALMLMCHWSEAGKPFNVGTKAAFTARGGLATLIADNVPPLMWFGDPA